MNKIKILENFRATLVAFFDDLIKAYPNQSDFYIARIMIKDRISITEIMSHFIKHVINDENKKIIESRDENIIFSKIFSIGGEQTTDHIKKYKNLWSETSSDNKKVIWDWVDVLVKFTEKYQTAKE